LQRQGLGTFQYILGSHDDCSHAWPEQNGLIVDITADQFPDMDAPLFVSADRAWHAAFNGEPQHVADFEIFDPHTRAILGATYAIVNALR